MDPWVQSYERAGHAYIKPFSYPSQKSLIKARVNRQRAAWRDVSALLPIPVFFFLISFFPHHKFSEEKARRQS